MEHKFKVGDRVLMTSDGMVNIPATIRRLNDWGSYGVEFDTKQRLGHDLDGLSPDRRGWNVSESDLKLIKEEPKMACKFNVGDKVMFRYIDDMIDEYKQTSPTEITGPDGRTLTISKRKKIAGATAIVTRVIPPFLGGVKSNTHELQLKDWSVAPYEPYHSYYDWMFCLVEKAQPKKKLSVAEVEKLLGYGVEIIKEGK